MEDNRVKIIEMKDRTPLLIEKLLEVWESSVRATHLFLSNDEINGIKQYVPEALNGVSVLIVAEDENGNPVGFMGVAEKMLEMLFVSNESRGQGIGKNLLQYGMEKHEIKELAVNEQNPLARGFYEHMGFEVYKRTELDEQGNPYPLLYMKRNNEVRQNYYGSLCTEMYELLHEKAPEDELEFYLSYATKDMKILEALCGSGRFFVPLYERGYHISGMDLSGEMLGKLKEKIPDADVIQADILEYEPEENYDYIFISSGSVSLFTDIELCKKILKILKEFLTPEGKLVFAVETMADRCPDDKKYEITASAKTKEGFDLILKSKNYYDEEKHIQFSPGIYELYQGDSLLEREEMDFQTYLYTFGEMEKYLEEIGFKDVKTYSSFAKELAVDDKCEMFLFECSI